MDTATEGRTRKPRGRKDESKQELVTQPKIVGELIDELVRLHTRSAEASNDLSEAIKSAAEKSGYNAAAIRKLVVARAGEKFAEAKRMVEQQMELFDEVGE